MAVQNVSSLNAAENLTTPPHERHFFYRASLSHRTVAKEMWQRNGNFLSNPIYLKKYDDFMAGGVPNCKAGRAFFNIDSTGDVAICVENRHRPIANIVTDTPAQIRDSLRQASKNNTCTACWYNCRGEVESLYSPKSLLMSLPTFFYNRGQADGGKMGRWQDQ